MVVGTTEMVSVEWIMQNSTWSVDHFNDGAGGVDYLAMVREKAGDSDQFTTLVSTIMRKGFRVPIVLCLNYSRYGGEVNNVVHGNGHHRMTAALLLMLNEIPVYWSDYEEEGYMVNRVSESEKVGTRSDIVKGLWEEWCSPWDE